MESAELIFQHFPNLSETQKKQFEDLSVLFGDWNTLINVISRKDMDSFYTRHVLHSLAISKVLEFKDGTKILDIGTGGGFPGIPLAILYPECDFFLVDSIGKKIKVVNEVSKAIGLTNIRTAHSRAEEIQEEFDFVVSRAVTAMPKFIKWTKGKFKKESNHQLPNGILYLKGGDLTEEMKTVKHATRYFNISEFFEDEFFETKKVVYVKMKN